MKNLIKTIKKTIMAKETILNASGIEFSKTSGYYSNGKPMAVYPSNEDLRIKNNIPSGTNIKDYYREGTMDVYSRNNELVLRIQENKFKILKDEDADKYYDSDGDFVGAPEPPYGGNS